MADRDDASPFSESTYNPLENLSDTPPETYVVYKKRWYMLVCVCLLNISNSMIWISFSPIADKTAKYYNTSNNGVNWLSLVYLVASIPFGFASQWLLDSLGLRIGLTAGGAVNFIGSLLRIISTISSISSEWRFPLVMIGQSLAACSQPFFLFAPTKLAALWFPHNQRATANMVASMANPIGILVANVISPLIVDKNNDDSTAFFHVQLAYAVPAGIALLLTLGITSAVPPTAPSSSAEEASEPFLEGLKQISRNRNYWFLVVSFGIGLGLFTSITTLLEQILCPWGYDDNFAGLCGALFIACGVVGAGAAGVYVDKTKKFEEVAKICLCLASISGIAFSMVFKLDGLEAGVIITSCLFGMLGFAIYPVCMELAVESTYPVAEATAAGFLIIAGQVFGIIFIISMQVMATDTPRTDLNKCDNNTEPHDYTMASLVAMGFSALGACLLTIFYKCDYKRLRSEQETEAKKVLNYTQTVSS